MKIEAIIVDDERSSRDVLRSLLEKFCPEVKVVAEAGTAEKAYELINKFKPALVFLDIQMPIENGFTLLKRFEKINFDVIFVTSFNQYAINAIKFSALDYLLKPVEVADLKAAVQKAVERASERSDNAPLIINLLNNVDEKKEKRIPLHVQGKVRFINISDINYIEAAVNYSQVIINNNEKIVTSKTLTEFEELFGELEKMIRINKSVIINADQIGSYSKQEPFLITLKDGKEFEISRRKRVEVLKLLKEK